MKIWPAYPHKNDLSLWEIFNQKEYQSGSQDFQKEVKLNSAQFRYEYESEISFFDKYFPHVNPTELSGKRIFDLGSFTGGRAVYWAERYGFHEIYGIDISRIFAQAGQLFATKKNIQANFLVGTGEYLPFSSDTFDAIISYDVLEHVQDVGQVLNECYRILKPGGKIYLVFPPFYQPLESHLGCVTKIPGLNCLFSGEPVFQAYQEIIRDRGEEAYWYAPVKRELEYWEKFPSLNGITISKFRKIIKKNKGWHLTFWNTAPIFSGGRASEKRIFRLLRRLFVLPARLPVLEEFFLDRICCILEKRTL